MGYCAGAGFSGRLRQAPARVPPPLHPASLPLRGRPRTWPRAPRGAGSAARSSARMRSVWAIVNLSCPSPGAGSAGARAQGGRARRCPGQPGEPAARAPRRRRPPLGAAYARRAARPVPRSLHAPRRHTLPTVELGRVLGDRQVPVPRRRREDAVYAVQRRTLRRHVRVELCCGAGHQNPDGTGHEAGGYAETDGVAAGFASVGIPTSCRRPCRASRAGSAARQKGSKLSRHRASARAQQTSGARTPACVRLTPLPPAPARPLAWPRGTRG